MRNIRVGDREYGLGYIPDLPDHRDHYFTIAKPKATPPIFSQRVKHPPVYDQLILGSCTGNGNGDLYEYALGRQKRKMVTPSRLFIYYNERAIEHTINSDSGAQIRDGIKSMAQSGVCTETSWPYVIAKFAKKPPQSCYASAALHKVTDYQRVPQDLDQLRQAIVSDLPVVIGFTVYSSFESQAVARTGIVPMPSTDEQVLGGHCVVIVGYDDEKQMFECRNSWGPEWGDHGYFWMPYAYILNADLASDFWVVKSVA